MSTVIPFMKRTSVQSVGTGARSGSTAARVFVIPPARRVDLVRREARVMAEMRANDAAWHLARIVDREVSKLHRVGAAPDRIEPHVRGLLVAIVAEFDALTAPDLQGGGDRTA